MITFGLVRVRLLAYVKAWVLALWSDTALPPAGTGARQRRCGAQRAGRAKVSQIGPFERLGSADPDGSHPGRSNRYG